MTTKSITHVIASEQSWIEGIALKQLETAAQLDGIIKAVGLPDLHPGKGIPVGAAFISKDIIYPHIIGNDIGCGMSFFKTDHSIKKIRLKKWVQKLELITDFNDFRYFESSDFLYNAIVTQSMGSIGGGNQFAELQVLDTVFAQDYMDDYNLDKDSVYLLVHCGSRGLGNIILDKYIREYHAQNGLKADSDIAREYLYEHDKACTWASSNRGIIAHKIAHAVGIRANTLNQIASCEHNSISPREIDSIKHFIHRKGASPGDNGIIMIPGSRGTLSYLVAPAHDTDKSAYSLPHGAGRKWERRKCKARLESNYTKESLKKTKLGSWVVCGNKALLYEEAPEAYKNIDQVIKDMEDEGLIKKIASFRPLITYKP